MICVKKQKLSNLGCILRRTDCVNGTRRIRGRAWRRVRIWCRGAGWWRVRHWDCSCILPLKKRTYSLLKTETFSFLLFHSTRTFDLIFVSDSSQVIKCTYLNRKFGDLVLKHFQIGESFSSFLFGDVFVFLHHTTPSLFFLLTSNKRILRRNLTVFFFFKKKKKKKEKEKKSFHSSSCWTFDVHFVHSCGMNISE